ncbi:MAG: hydroxymethylbilane synthase [candidate division WOR-3 bacterium]
MVKKIRVGARSSKLSRIQTEKVVKILNDKGFETIFVPIKTKGDIDKKTPLYKLREKGIFVKALEESLLRNEIDIAVHSAKDVPTEISENFMIFYIEREEPVDVIVCNYKKIEEIPQNARIGTGSKRREYFLKIIRPDFKFLPLRGNIETRIKKWENGEYEGIVMAKCAIKRLSLNVPYIELPIEDFPPPPGQGAICVETLKNSSFVQILREINNKKVETEVNIEREILKKIGGGCAVPFGCYAEINGSEIILKMMYVKDDKVKKAMFRGKNKEEILEKVYEFIK